MRYESFSRDDTYGVGETISAQANPGDVYCLTGELGAGKTVFAKGFAKGLEVECEIASPTFTILNAYQGCGRLDFFHFDAYRLSSARELEDTGADEYLYGDGVCLVEWADLVKDAIPENACWIEIRKDYAKGEDYRLIIICTGYAREDGLE